MCLPPGNTGGQLTAIPLEQEVLKMLPGAKFIYCADAGLGSYNIRKFNSMGGRSFVVTQSVKKLSDALKEAVFNDYDYRLLSNDRPVSVEGMKTFDRHDEENLKLYNDSAYKVLEADRAVDLGLYEEKTLKNGRTIRVKAKGLLKQRIIITLKNMNVANIHDVKYMALYNGSKALDALTRLTMLPLDRLHYKPKELNKMIKKFLK